MRKQFDAGRGVLPVNAVELDSTELFKLHLSSFFLKLTNLTEKYQIFTEREGKLQNSI